MKINLVQALHKRMEAHQAAKAYLYHAAVLKAQPKNPIANYNKVALAEHVGRIDEALPFFKNAADGNTDVPHFWPSCLYTVMKSDRQSEAKAVFDQARTSEIIGSFFEQFKKRINKSLQLEKIR